MPIVLGSEIGCASTKRRVEVEDRLDSLIDWVNKAIISEIKSTTG